MEPSKSNKNNNNNNVKQPQAIYGQTSLTTGVVDDQDKTYARVDVAQEGAVYGETSLNADWEKEIVDRWIEIDRDMEI